MKKNKHQPIPAEGRTLRIVKRRQEKKTMKSLIAELKQTVRLVHNERFIEGLAAGIDFTLSRTQGMEYGAEYDVTPA